MTFRIEPTPDDRFEDAFAVLQSVAAWLEHKGRRQRITSTTRDRYAEWQSANQNYVVLENDVVAGVFTICEERLTDWLEHVTDTPLPFLRALATHPTFRGREVGSIATRYAIEHVAPNALFLDCVSDFLPDYYASVGFEKVARQVRCYPDGEYDITLMKSGGMRDQVLGIRIQ